jgi:hypothetical protein
LVGTPVREERIKHVVPPLVADPQVVAQQAFETESEFLGERARWGVVRMDERLHAMQTQFAEAKFEHRGDGLGADPLPLTRGIDDIADGAALIADVAVMVVDHAEAAIGRSIRYRPKPIVGRGAVAEAPDRALGLDAPGVDWRIPEAHRLGIGEAFVHRVRILGMELAQAKARGSECRVRCGALSHVGSLT